MPDAQDQRSLGVRGVRTTVTRRDATRHPLEQAARQPRRRRRSRANAIYGTR
jgi:hypothetical protein